MLGNVKFIGELGKLQMLEEAILHQCIQELLEKTKGSYMTDMAEDLECLSQILKTCGAVLEKPQAKMLMDQYFERINYLIASNNLPARIRFMLQDVLDMRKNNWRTRQQSAEKDPTTRIEIRKESILNNDFNPQFNMAFDGQHYLYPYILPIKNVSIVDNTYMHFPNSVQSNIGPAVHRRNGIMNGYHVYNHNFSGVSTMGNSYGNILDRSYNHFNNSGKLTNQYFNRNKGEHFSNTNTDLPPRFKKMYAQQKEQQFNLSYNMNSEEVSLRPAQSSIMLNCHVTIPSKSISQDLLPPTATLQPNVVPSRNFKESAIIFKPVGNDKNKANRKEKGLSKEDLDNKILTFLEKWQNSVDMNNILASFCSLSLPDRFLASAITFLMNQLIIQSDENRSWFNSLLSHFHQNNILQTSHFLEALHSMLDQIEDLEIVIPKARSRLAVWVAHWISNVPGSLLDIAELFEEGRHYPLFFLIFQQLHQIKGQVWLLEIFEKSKINLLMILPEADRSKDRLAEILEDKNLSFLQPLLRIQNELESALDADPTANGLYKWIRTNLHSDYHTDATFISALITCILKHVTNKTQDLNEHAQKELEKELLIKFKPVLVTFLRDRLDLQLIAIYGVQVFCNAKSFPTGMLLRWFSNLYDLEILYEEAFLKWKEDLSHDYPGKGKALIQVHKWLDWLSQAESDEEEWDDGE